MSTAERLITADEFDELEEPEEGGKLELDEGRLCVEMPVNADHGMLQVRISGLLDRFVREHARGEVYVETAFRLQLPGGEGDTVRAPDVSYVRRQPTREERRSAAMHYGPDLAVEVVSPSDRDLSIRRKVRQYLEAGVARVWVVRAEEGTVTVHRPGGDAHTYAAGDTLTSEDAAFEVEGFALSLDDLFRDG